MSFIPFRHPLSGVFSPFGLGRYSAPNKPTIAVEPEPAPVSYEGKLFIYTGSLDSETLIETVVDAAPRLQRCATTAKPQPITQPALTDLREEQSAPFYGAPILA